MKLFFKKKLLILIFSFIPFLLLAQTEAYSIDSKKSQKTIRINLRRIFVRDKDRKEARKSKKIAEKEKKEKWEKVYKAEKAEKKAVKEYQKTRNTKKVYKRMKKNKRTSERIRDNKTRIPYIKRIFMKEKH
jgi:hypothetical protein